jgi:hypothetical protein
MDQIDELKQMQKFPRFHLSNYFNDLKNEIDIKYAVKQDEPNEYLEIIKNIESFEQLIIYLINNNNETIR